METTHLNKDNMNQTDLITLSKLNMGSLGNATSDSKHLKGTSVTNLLQLYVSYSCTSYVLAPRRRPPTRGFPLSTGHAALSSLALASWAQIQQDCPQDTHTVSIMATRGARGIAGAACSVCTPNWPHTYKL